MVQRKESRRNHLISLLLGPIVRPLLPIIHKVYTIALGVKSLGGSSSLICVELRRHKGQAVKLSDGCEVRPGDPVIKLHFNNAWFDQQRQSDPGSRTAVFPHGLTRYFKDGFRLLAAQVADGKYGGVIAVYGWTVLHTPAKRLGFQVIDLSNTLRMKLALRYITGLMQVYRVSCVRRYKVSHKPLKVKAIWLSIDEFLRLYHSC
ncbi:MAG: hypothetical protein R6V59_08520 [Dehalococcoidia bacterium]